MLISAMKVPEGSISASNLVPAPDGLPPYEKIARKLALDPTLNHPEIVRGAPPRGGKNEVVTELLLKEIAPLVTPKRSVVNFAPLFAPLLPFPVASLTLPSNL